MAKKPFALIILDGWGYRKESAHNPTRTVPTPTINNLFSHYPHILIEASGAAVGLPDGQMGNSEVGHLHIGAGRKVPQDLVRISHDIKNGGFFENKTLLNAIELAKKNNKAVHVLGLLSDGGVHSHIDHLCAMIEMIHRNGVTQNYFHAICDGRDTPPQSALPFIERIEKLYASFENPPSPPLVKGGDNGGPFSKGGIVSVIGRYYAMDRDKRWERTQKAYDLLTMEYKIPPNPPFSKGGTVGADSSFSKGGTVGADSSFSKGGTVGADSSFSKGKIFVADSAENAVKNAYARGETDEFISPTLIVKNNQSITINDGDVVIFMNFRADRARQLTAAFVEKEFHAFSREKTVTLAAFVSLTKYFDSTDLSVAYLPFSIHNTLGEVISQHGLTQLRLAETEKYAHVTYFLNGGTEEPYQNESRQLIPSPKVATYDKQPEMSAIAVTDAFVAAIESQQYDAIICNYANPDMIGHTGVEAAAEKAMVVIDACLNRVLTALKKANGEALITSDHGNIEMMYDEKTGQPHTAHTTNLVPLIYVGRPAKITAKTGALDDVAPTMLYLMGLEKPIEMTGNILFKP